MKATINIDWIQPDEREQGREDACWYIYQSSSDIVCYVSDGANTLRISADGEMRIIVLDENGEQVGIIRYADQFREYGITNDKQLEAIVFGGAEHTTPTGYKVTFDVVNNPWFDIYDDNGEHLDMVCFSLTEAIGSGEESLTATN